MCHVSLVLNTLFSSCCSIFLFIFCIYGMSIYYGNYFVIFFCNKHSKCVIISFSTDSPFQLTNKDTGFCLVKTNSDCNDLRWTTGDRLLVLKTKKCLGVQGKSVGSEINRYDCDEKSDLQRWECKNGTVLALKDQELYVELTADSTAVLSKTIGPNNHLTITGTSNGACARTYRGTG